LVDSWFPIGVDEVQRSGFITEHERPSAKPMTQSVKDLEAKIKFLAKALNTSENALLGAKRETVRSGYRTNRLNDDIELELAQKCGFDLKWPEWRVGTKIDFERRFTQYHAVATTGPRLKAIRTTQPESSYEPIASMQLFASQPGPGESWPLSADLVCQPARMEGVVVAVKRGWLTFYCGEAEANRLNKRAGYPGGLVVGNATCTPVAAYTQRPSWELYAASGPLGIVPLPHDFCPVFGLTPGGTVIVTFSVYIKDLEDEEMAEVAENANKRDQDYRDPDAPQSDSDSFIRPGFPGLGAAKKKILKRLALKQISCVGEPELHEQQEGRKMICADRLTFVVEKRQPDDE
jgi:hypothetical protein